MRCPAWSAGDAAPPAAPAIPFSQPPRKQSPAYEPDRRSSTRLTANIGGAAAAADHGSPTYRISRDRALASRHDGDIPRVDLSIVATRRSPGSVQRWRPWLTARTRARTSPLCCCCQVVAGIFCEVRLVGGGVRAVAPGRMVVSGPGVACPKSRRAGCEPAALDAESFPGCPPGPVTCSISARTAARSRSAVRWSGTCGMAVSPLVSA